MSPRRRRLDYYRQFEAMSPQETSQRLRSVRAEQRSQELARVDDLDLASLTWHEPPDPELVNAATYALRRSINRYPEGGGPAVAAIAAFHGVPEERVALGHGAGQLLQAALRELAEGGEVVVPWPAWAPLPTLIARAGARPVEAARGPLAELPVGPDTRAIVLCSPNDPTGDVLDPAELRAFAESLPPQVTVLVDEALVELAPADASVAPLLDELPNLLVFRSFSKAWSLAGLRVGYVLGSATDAELLRVLGPGQGVASPAQAAVAAALDDEARARLRLQQRRTTAARERARLAEALDGLPFAFAPSQTHAVWMRGDGMTAAQITHALAEQKVHVASGAQWGDDDHVRVTLRDQRATERLVAALRILTG